MRYYHSTDATISTDDTEVGADAVGSLPAVDRSAESISPNAPWDAGTYYCGACVDEVAGESNTENKCSSGISVAVSGGGDVQGYIEAVRSLLKQIPPDARIIPGHGPLAAVDDLRTALEMLETCADLVKESLAAGKTLEEIQAAGVPEKWQSWGQGWMSTERWLAIVYNSYK